MAATRAGWRPSARVYDEIVPAEVQAWLEGGAKLVDVREPWEFATGRLPGAVNIPIGEVVARQEELTTPLVLVCAIGSRSGRVAEYLAQRGMSRVANLVGGTVAWIQEGRVLEHDG